MGLVQDDLNVLPLHPHGHESVTLPVDVITAKFEAKLFGVPLNRFIVIVHDQRHVGQPVNQIIPPYFTGSSCRLGIGLFQSLFSTICGSSDNILLDRPPALSRACRQDRCVGFVPKVADGGVQSPDLSGSVGVWGTL